MTVLLAFTLEHAARVTEIPERRIRYWDKTGVIRPSLVREVRGGPYGRIYSFRDLVGLRTIAELRGRFGVSLQKLRIVGDRLRSQFETPWSELRFYVSDGHLYYRDPGTELMLSALSRGQVALVESLDLVTVAHDTEDRARHLVKRTVNQLGAVKTNRYVFSNRPVIAGTRIPTAAIREFYDAGYDIDAIVDEYPRLTPIDVEQAIRHERELAEGHRAS